MNKKRLLSLARELKRHYLGKEVLEYSSDIVNVIAKHTDIKEIEWNQKSSTIKNYFDINDNQYCILTSVFTTQDLINRCRQLVKENE